MIPSEALARAKEYVQRAIEAVAIAAEHRSTPSLIGVHPALREILNQIEDAIDETAQ